MPDTRSSSDYPFSLSDLSDRDIELLTFVLSLPVHVERASRSWKGFVKWRLIERQKAVTCLENELPRHLRSPIPIRIPIANLLSGRPDLPPAYVHFLLVKICPPFKVIMLTGFHYRAPLCQTHAKLNAYVLYSVLKKFKAEISERLDLLTKSVAKLLPEQQDLVRDLLDLQALWDRSHRSQAPSADRSRSKWSFQADECAACTLARVGGDLNMLRLLRTTLLARRKRGRPRPQLLRWVNSWIDYTPRSEEIRTETVEPARRLMNARRAARKALNRGELTSSTERYDDLSDGLADDGLNDSDIEGEIIEDYRNGAAALQPEITSKATAGEPSRRARAGENDGSSYSRIVGNRPSRSSKAPAEEYRRLLPSWGQGSDDWV